MRVYVGFDDTDVKDADRGTGKFARWFEKKLPRGIRLHGIVRQQLPLLDEIPYTSKNSAACLILDDVALSQLDEIIERCHLHIRDHFIDGSDPGLCVVVENGASTLELEEFGRIATSRIVSQNEAMMASKNFHLSGHGGTNDGIIGAAAGVGLTISGWHGRFIEYNDLRSLGQVVQVAELEAKAIRVLSVDKDAITPAMSDTVDTNNWLRPRLWAGQAVLPVTPAGEGRWLSIGGKNKG